MYKILKIIEKCLSGWDVSDIFHDGHTRCIEYDKPDVDFFGTHYGYSYNDYTYTALGEWFKAAPRVLSLLKVFWYAPVWCVWMITNILWIIIELFLSTKTKESLY